MMGSWAKPPKLWSFENFCINSNLKILSVTEKIGEQDVLLASPIFVGAVPPAPGPRSSRPYVWTMFIMYFCAVFLNLFLAWNRTRVLIGTGI